MTTVSCCHSMLGIRMYAFARFALVVAALSSPACLRPALAHSMPTTLIHAGHVLEHPDRAPRRQATLVIRDGRIVEIRAGFIDASAFPEAQVVDLRDCFVLPGLIDTHVHFNTSNSGQLALLDRVTLNTADYAYEAAWLARKTLENGFTTVRVLGNPSGVTLALRDAIAAGKVPGPRILDGGRTIATTAGSGDPAVGLNEDIAEHVNHENVCDGPEMCRRAVRQQVRRGVDWIKMKVTGGVNSRSSVGVGAQMFADEVRAIVETAHMYGKKVAVHAHGTDGINLALEYGADSIEHATLLDDRSLELFARSGAYMVPTLSTINAYIERMAKNPDQYTPAVREKIEWRISVTGDALKRAYAKGVKIAFGTDAGVSEHGRNADEFALMVKFGMTPRDALKAATVNAADMLGLSKEIGTLEPGKRADLIAVASDPLQDVGVLRNVSFVMKDGEIWKR